MRNIKNGSGTILLGEDELEVRSYLEMALRCQGYSVEMAQDGEELLSCLPGPAPAERVQGRLRELLGRAWSGQWRKAVNPKPRPHKPKGKHKGAHTSVHKVLEAAKAAKQKEQKVSPSSG